MHGDVLLLVVLLVVGCAAFFFGIIYVFCQAMAWMGRGALALFRPRRAGTGCSIRAAARHHQVCPNDRCRKVEQRPARYCSQCGTAFEPGLNDQRESGT